MLSSFLMPLVLVCLMDIAPTTLVGTQSTATLSCSCLLPEALPLCGLTRPTSGFTSANTPVPDDFFSSDNDGGGGSPDTPLTETQSMRDDGPTHVRDARRSRSPARGAVSPGSRKSRDPQSRLSASHDPVLCLLLAVRSSHLPVDPLLLLLMVRASKASFCAARGHHCSYR